MVHIGNGNKIKNSNICSRQLIVGEEIIVNGKRIAKPPCGGHNISIINDRVFADGYEYRDGKWVKTFSSVFYKYF